jgi:hypothetical protein
MLELNEFKPSRLLERFLNEEIPENELACIYEQYSNGLDPVRFSVFVNQAVANNADPFAGDVTPKIFKQTDKDTGQVTYRVQSLYSIHYLNRKMQQHPLYFRHVVCSVHANDTIKVNISDEGVHVRHEIGNAAKRGTVVSAYALIYKKNSKIPHFTEVSFSELGNRRSFMQAHMLKKVCLACAIREAFPGFACYATDEFPGAVKDLNVDESSFPDDENNDAKINLDEPPPIVTPDKTEIDSGNIVNNAQVDKNECALNDDTKESEPEKTIEKQDENASDDNDFTLRRDDAIDTVKKHFGNKAKNFEYMNNLGYKNKYDIKTQADIEKILKSLGDY